MKSPPTLFILVVTGALWLYFFSTLPATYVVQLNDFPAYYGAGKMIATGQPELLYRGQFKWFTNLPIVAVIFSPLSQLEYPSAWRLFWWIQLASFLTTFAVVCRGIQRHFPPFTAKTFALTSLVFLVFAPVLRRCLVLGQTTPMMVLLFAFIYLAWRAGRFRLAGGLLGVLCLIKIPPMLFIPLLLLRRRFEVGLTALAVLALGVGASFAGFGSELVQQYADRVIWDNFGLAQAAFNNQSLDGLFMRVFSERGLADWSTIPRPVPVTLGVGGCAIAIAALLIARAPGILLPRVAPDDRDPRTGSLELELALGVALMLLLFPVVWIHYYLFLIVPIALLPAWWIARGIPAAPGLIALLVLGVLLASGLESHENAWYEARQGDFLVRMLQNVQPSGALLIVLGLSTPLAEIARRQRRPD